MRTDGLAKRYAEAFLGYAAPAIGFDKAVDELYELKMTLSRSRDLMEFLENRWVSYFSKSETVDKALAGFSDETRRLVKFLLKKNRIASLMDILDYTRSSYYGGAAVDALLKTSYILENELIEKIKKALEAKFRKKLRLFIELDPDLLGGVQVTVGNTMLDGSVNARLEDLRAKLMAVRVG